VEAMEGTDAAIERAGQLMRSLGGDASTLQPSDEVGAGVPFRAGASLHPGERWADLTKAFGYPAPLARV